MHKPHPGQVEPPRAVKPLARQDIPVLRSKPLPEDTPREDTSSGQAPPEAHPRRTPHRADQPRLFHLVRDTDPSGISGTGIVAEGCLFTSGKVALNWRSEVPSTGVYDHIDDVRLVHGHNGASHIEWLT